MLSVGTFQKLPYMFVLCLLQSGLTTEKQTVYRLAFLTKYDTLALSLLISLVLGISTLEARQFMSIKNALSLGFCPHQRTGDEGGDSLGAAGLLLRLVAWSLSKFTFPRMVKNS